MSDLIQRLRNEGSSALRKQYSLGMWALCVEAADTIDLLRAELTEVRETLATNTEAARQAHQR